MLLAGTDILRCLRLVTIFDCLVMITDLVITRLLIQIIKLPINIDLGSNSVTRRHTQQDQMALFGLRCAGWFTLVSLVFVSILSTCTFGQRFDSALSPCPNKCDLDDTSAWTYYHNLGDLERCNGTTLFQLNLHNGVSDPDTHVSLRACTSSGGSVRPMGAIDNRIIPRQLLSFNKTTPSSRAVSLTTWGISEASDSNGDAQAAVDALSEYLQHDVRDVAIVFSRSGSAIAGLYVGSQISSTSAAAAVSQFRSFLGQGMSSDWIAIQACGSGNRTISAEFFGVVVDTTGDVSAVQDALRSWDDAECLEDGTTVTWDSIAVDVIPGSSVSIAPYQDVSGSLGVGENSPTDENLEERQAGACRYTQGKLLSWIFGLIQSMLI